MLLDDPKPTEETSNTESSGTDNEAVSDDPPAPKWLYGSKGEKDKIVLIKKQKD